MSGFNEIDIEQFMGLSKLNKDLKLAAKTLSDHEVRYLVDTYIQMQKRRIASNNAAKAIAKEGEPNNSLVFITHQNELLEDQVRTFLRSYAQSTVVGKWCLSNLGIGEVVTSGLIAFIDIKKAPTTGHILRFAGQDPTIVWEKGKLRPFNARLKVICYYAGLGFRYVCNKQDADYGKLYKYRKAVETARNENGDFAEQAKTILVTKNFRDDTKAKEVYLTGKLPPAHLDARARRWAVRIFLSHLHEVMYWNHYGIVARRPYSFDNLHHPHVIAPPHLEMLDEKFEKELRKRCPMVTVDQYIDLH
jgi:hypothetical protein